MIASRACAYCRFSCFISNSIKHQRLLQLLHDARASLNLVNLVFIQLLAHDGLDPMGAKNAGQTQENFFLDPVKSLKKKMRWLMNNAFTYIHYINLGHVTKRNDCRALGARTISGYFDTIMERQKRRELGGCNSEPYHRHED